MAEKTQSGALNIYLAEYEKLKDEQIARIGFREESGVCHIDCHWWYSFLRAHRYRQLLRQHEYYPLQRLFSVRYLNNDYKITTIGQYMRVHLLIISAKAAGAPEIRVLQWELIYKLEPRRFERKVLQVIVNDLFVGSGFVALLAYFTTSTTIYTPLRWLASVELQLCRCWRFR